MIIAATLTGLFGCKSESEYTVSDIKLLSISCGQMDLRQCYSFGISQKDGGWILYAECFAADVETQIKLETPISNEDAQTLLAEAEKSDFITLMLEYKKPLFKAKVADETDYSSQITFSDGKTISAPILVSREIETRFYALAQYYAGE